MSSEKIPILRHIRVRIKPFTNNLYIMTYPENMISTILENMNIMNHCYVKIKLFHIYFGHGTQNRVYLKNVLVWW